MRSPTSLLSDMARFRLFQATVRGRQVVSMPTAPWRSSPDFLVVGAQRSGTTTLYRSLAAHPQVRFPLMTKSVHWFDVQYQRSPAWYRAGFPLRSAVERDARRLDAPVVVGEAAPYYGFHPFVPARIADHLPEVRLVMILRDPVTRAWSQFHHERARGWEPLADFGAALDAEEVRLDRAEEVLVGRPGHHLAHQHQSYVARGRYAEQVQRLWAAVGRDRVLVLYTEDLERRPGPTFDVLHDFLGVGRRPVEPGRWNPRSAGTIPAEHAERIRALTARSDAWLAENLPAPPPWLAPVPAIDAAAPAATPATGDGP